MMSQCGEGWGWGQLGNGRDLPEDEEDMTMRAVLLRLLVRVVRGALWHRLLLLPPRKAEVGEGSNARERRGTRRQRTPRLWPWRPSWDGGAMGC